MLNGYSPSNCKKIIFECHSGTAHRLKTHCANCQISIKQFLNELIDKELKNHKAPYEN